MRLTRIVALSMVAATIGFTAAEADSLGKNAVPAEVPPASFKGKQYVDSRGCVFIRAGIDGMVNWVPRVTRSRDMLCGYQPTFAQTETKPAQVPVPEVKPTAPESKPATTAAAAPEATAPKVAPVARPAKIAEPARQSAMKTTAATPAPKPVVAKTRRAAPKPKPVAIAKPAPAPAPVQVRTTRTPTAHNPCTNLGNSGRYYTGAETAVRCGPQTQTPATIIRREDVVVMRNGKPVTVQRRVVSQRPAGAAAAPVASGKVRVVPRHVWEQQQAATAGVRVPEGYRPVWKDDRLNPRRAHQSLDGIRSTDLIWTRTVPRQLYVRRTGQVVTHKYPNLIYPYVSYKEMQDAGYSIADNGTIPGQRPVKVRRVAGSKKAKSLVSTKAAPANASKAGHVKAPQAASTGRYVQVGMFGVPANAKKTAARLQAAGLPVRMGTLNKGGKSYRVVMAGPFSPEHLGAALSKTRNAGFRDAFIR